MTLTRAWGLASEIDGFGEILISRDSGLGAQILGHQLGLDVASHAEPCSERPRHVRRDAEEAKDSDPALHDVASQIKGGWG